MLGKPRVFISYCRSDGATLASQLRQRLEAEHPEITLWQDVISERGGRDWWLQIREALDQVEYMVLVLTPDAMQSSTVRKEWHYARQKGVYVYPVQGSDKLDFSTLPRWIKDLHIADLGYDVSQKRFASTGQWDKFINDLNTRFETPRVPFMVGPLPENFVERPHEFDQLVALLRDEKREESIAITTALVGAGGFGKTTLARALCHDGRILEAFDDGILWTTLGEKPSDLTGKIVDLIEVLSGERPGFRDVEAASARLRELLAERDILMVIDDVWDAAHLQPFLDGGERCARLITTRNLETLPAKAQQVNVNAMQQREAISVLAAELSHGNEDAEQLGTLAKDLGEWPLLLQLVNRVLRERVLKQKQPLRTALNYVQKALAKRGLTAFDGRNSASREQAVAQTVGVSLELLSNTERERYAELAIFPEDTDVPLSTVVQLWNATGGLDEFDGEELCARLHGLSLLMSFDLTTCQIRLHDVMRKFLASRLTAAAVVHGKLVDAWGEPHHLRDDYAWRFLSFHLVECHRAEQLGKLLLDFDWMRGKLNATDIAALVSDYDYVTNQEAELCMVRGALQLSAHLLATNDGKTQLAAQLLGRLLTSDASSIQGLLRQAAQSEGASWLCPLSSSLIRPGGPLLRTLAGHTAPVRAVAISADGVLATSASEDKTLKVWDLRTGKLLHSLEGHSAPIRAVAITADGALAVSGSLDKTLKIWDLKTGKLLHSLEGHSSFVLAVAVTADGAAAVSASADNTLVVWNLKPIKLLHRLRGHSNALTAVAITTDGAQAVSGSLDNTLKIWDLKIGKLLHSLEGHSARVHAVAITPDSKEIISASADNTLNVWELKTGEFLRSLNGHRAAATGVAITADGAFAVSSSSDGTLRVWDFKTSKLLHTLIVRSIEIPTLAITANGAMAVSTWYDNTLKVWDLKTTKPQRSLDGHATAVTALAIAADGALVVSASNTELKVWDLKTGNLVRSLTGRHRVGVTAIAATPNGSQAVSCAWLSNSLEVWDLKTGELLASLEGHTDDVEAVAITADSTQVVSASADHTLKVWDLRTSKLLISLVGHSSRVTIVAITGNRAEAVSGSWDKTLKVWELKTGKLLHSLEGHSAPIQAVAITPDSRWIVSASHDHTLKVWELKTGKLLHSLEGHSAPVQAVAITANSKWVVSASHDHTLKVWELKTGKLLHSLEGHNAPVQAVAITPDSRWVVSASHDHTLKAWDVEMGQLMATFTADGSLSVCAMVSDGRAVVAGDELGNVHFLKFGWPKSGLSSKPLHVMQGA